VFASDTAVSARTVADLQPEEWAQIERIPSVLNALCRRLGLHEGQWVRTRSISPLVLALETDLGRRAIIGLEWAVCIEIAPS
jgi:hypothetical protein